MHVLATEAEFLVAFILEVAAGEQLAPLVFAVRTGVQLSYVWFDVGVMVFEANRAHFRGTGESKNTGI
jgi:hypothetical protein